MKNKLIATIAALVMILGIISSVAAISTDASKKNDINVTVGNATTLVGTLEPDRASPTDGEQKNIDAFMRKNGGNTNLEFFKYSYDEIFKEKDKDLVVELSKALKLRGWVDDGVSTLYVARENLRLDRKAAPLYHVVYAIFTDVKNAVVDAAVIKAYPYGYYEGGAKLYAFDAKIMDINADMTSYMDKYFNKIAQPLGQAIPGYRASASLSKNFRTYFNNNGWGLSNKAVYTNIPNPGYEISPAYYQVLSDADVSKAMEASASDGPQVMMIMPSSTYAFAERVYKSEENGSTLRTHVTFCAYGLNEHDGAYNATFSWIMVRTQLDGEMTSYKEFYPLTAKINTMLADAKADGFRK